MLNKRFGKFIRVLIGIGFVMMFLAPLVATPPNSFLSQEEDITLQESEYLTATDYNVVLAADGDDDTWHVLDGVTWTHATGYTTVQTQNTTAGPVYYYFQNRFQLNIPKDATIESANWSLWEDYDTVVRTCFIRRINEENVGSLEGDSVRPIWSNTTVLGFSTDGDGADEWKTVSITELVQEQVNLAGWSTGDYIGLIAGMNTTAASGLYKCDDYQHADDYLSHLNISYTAAEVTPYGDNWLEGWGRRQQHNISQTAGTGAEYTVPFTVWNGPGGFWNDYGGYWESNAYVGGYAQDDFDDIRWTGNNGSTELEYQLNATWESEITDYISNDSEDFGAYPVNYPSSFYYNQRTYISRHGLRRDPVIAYYDHENETWSGWYRFGDNSILYDADDTHGAPALFVDNEGYIHVFYGAHSTPNPLLFHSKSDYPERLDAWTAQVNVDWTDDGSITYPHLFYDATNDVLHCYVRLTAGAGVGTYPIHYRNSTDKGLTWSDGQNIVEADSYFPYTGVAEMDPTNTSIHLGWNRYTSANVSYQDVYYIEFNFTTGTVYNVSGSSMGEMVTYGEIDYCRVYDSSMCNVWGPDIHLDSDTYPYLTWVCGDHTGEGSGKIMFTYWTGSAWASVDNVTDTWVWVGGHDFIVYDSTNITAFLSESTASSRNMTKYTWNGATWTRVGAIIEGGSTRFQGYNSVPMHHNDEIQIVWTEYIPNDTNIKMYAYGSDGLVQYTWSKRALFYVRVPDDLTIADATIYLYYANNTVSTTENATMTIDTGNDPEAGVWGLEEEAPAGDGDSPVNVQSPECSNLDDTDNLYANYQQYEIEVCVSDADGYADITYIEFTLYSNDQVTPYWTIRYTEATDTFSEQTDTNNIITLDASSSTNSSSGTELNATFYITVHWNHTDLTDVDAKCYVLDDDANSDTDWYEINWDIETRLDITSLAVDDNLGTIDRGNLDGTFYTTGTVTYYGSSLNPASDAVDVWVSCSEYGTQTGPWSDLTLTSGVFNVTSYADDVYGLDTYIVKVVEEGTGSGGSDLLQSSEQDTYIADLIVVQTTTADDTRLDMNANSEIRVTLWLAYDSSYLGSGDSVILNDTAMSWDAGNSWFELSRSQSTVDLWKYFVNSSYEATHGISSFDLNSQYVDIIWDGIIILTTTADDGRIDYNTQATIAVTAELEYDHHSLGSGDSLYMNDTVMSWNGTHFILNPQFAQVDIWNFFVNSSSASEATYGITVINLDGNSVNQIWDRLLIDIQADDESVLNGVQVNFTLVVTYNYDGSTCTTYTIQIDRNATNWFTFIDGNKSLFNDTSSNCAYLYNASSSGDGVSESTYGLTVFITNTETVIWYPSGTPINEFAPYLTNPDDADNLYARLRFYIITSNCSDPQGYADIFEIYLLLYDDGRGTNYWTIKYVESTNTFSIVNGSSYIVLGSCSYFKSGNMLNLTWTIKIDWDHTDLTDIDMKQYVIDNSAEDDEDFYELNWDVETRLDYSVGFSLNDGSGTSDRGDLNGTITASGIVNYYGSAIHPLANETDVWISSTGYGANSGPWMSNLNSTGGFEYLVYADDVVGLDTFTCKIVANGTGSGGTDLYYTTSFTDTYIADLINWQSWITDSYISYYKKYRVWIRFTYAYDGLPVTGADASGANFKRNSTLTSLSHVGGFEDDGWWAWASGYTGYYYELPMNWQIRDAYIAETQHGITLVDDYQGVLHLDGNDYIRFPADSDFASDGNTTIELFFMVPVSGYGYLVSIGGDGTGSTDIGVQVSFISGNTFDCWIHGSGALNFHSGYVFTFGVWHHLILKSDSNGVDLWVDGVLIKSNQAGSLKTTIASPALYFGRNNWVSSQYLEYYISYFYYWNVTLSDWQVEQMFMWDDTTTNADWGIVQQYINEVIAWNPTSLNESSTSDFVKNYVGTGNGIRYGDCDIVGFANFVEGLLVCDIAVFSWTTDATIIVGEGEDYEFGALSGTNVTFSISFNVYYAYSGTEIASWTATIDRYTTGWVSWYSGWSGADFNESQDSVRYGYRINGMDDNFNDNYFGIYRCTFDLNLWVHGPDGVDGPSTYGSEVLWITWSDSIVILRSNVLPELAFEDENVTISGVILPDFADVTYVWLKALTAPIGFSDIWYVMNLEQSNLYTYEFENLPTGYYAFKIVATDDISNSSVTADAIIDFRIQLRVLEVMDPTYSPTETEVHLSGRVSKACGYYVFENNTYIFETGNLLLGSFSITWIKNTSIFLFRWGIKFNDTSTTRWINGSYENQLPTTEAGDLIIEVFDYDTSGYYITITCITNWANTTIYMYDNSTLEATASEGSDIQFPMPILVGLHNLTFFIDGGAQSITRQRSYTIAESTTITAEVRFAFFDTSNNWIPFETINCNLTQGGNKYVLTSNIATVLTAENMTLEVFNKWGIIIYNQTFDYTQFKVVDLLLYELVIDNMADHRVRLDISYNGTYPNITIQLPPNFPRFLYLASANYTMIFTYYAPVISTNDIIDYDLLTGYYVTYNYELIGGGYLEYTGIGMTDIMNNIDYTRTYTNDNIDAVDINVLAIPFPPNVPQNIVTPEMLWILVIGVGIFGVSMAIAGHGVKGYQIAKNTRVFFQRPENNSNKESYRDEGMPP